MDSTAAVLGQSLPFSSSCYYAPAKELHTSSCKLAVVGRRRTPAIGILSSEFSDRDHLQYYNCKNSGSYPSSAAAGMGAAMEGKDRAVKKMKKKKQLKLVKELSRDLSTFSQIGFGLDADGALVDQVKRDTMKEAADLLLERLQKIRAEEKELKRKAKEEKARLKAQMKTKTMDCEMPSTSSSSSESSDSECGEVIDMNSLKKQTEFKQENCLPQETDVNPIPIQSNQIEAIPGTACAKPGTLSKGEAITTLNPAIPKRIEVCMGGKCKKSGGLALLEEFQKAVGIEGAVSGCKCMGKCKEGPNVKVLNGVGGETSVGTVQASNALCIGVGLEDVDRIVANFMSGDKQLGFAAAS